MRLIVILLTLMLSSVSAWAQPSGTNWTLKYGKYSCTASKYVQGSYEFQPRGAFTITPDSQYVYHGFEKPSRGTFSVDKSGNLLFKGGYFDGGKAEKTDRTNRFLLVFPSNPDSRWSCSLLEP